MARVTIPVDRSAAMTFREFARGCTEQLRRWGYSEETIDQYDRVYMQFLAHVKAQGAHDDLRSFNDRLVYSFAESLGQRGIHPNTIIKALSALSTLAARYGMMATDGKGRRLVSEDPTKSFRWPQAQRQETKYVAPDDLRKLVDVAAPPWKALARDVLIETGIRVGEASRLNVEHFRQADGRYYLAVVVKGRGQQKRKVTNDVPLSKALGDALRDALLNRYPDLRMPSDAPLLVNSEGKRWSRGVLSTMVARLAKEAGVTRMRVSAHKLRHTANVIARQADVDAATRGRMLGHTSLRSLERYDHVLPHELHDARDKTTDALRRYLGKPDHVDAKDEGVMRNDGEAKAVKDKETGPP